MRTLYQDSYGAEAIVCAFGALTSTIYAVAIMMAPLKVAIASVDEIKADWEAQTALQHSQSRSAECHSEWRHSITTFS